MKMFIKDLPEYSFDFINNPASAGVYNPQGGKTGGDIELLDAYSRAVTGVVAKVGPTVAHIHVKKKASGRRPGAQSQTEGSGSGFVIAPDGYVVTNCHVVDGADIVEVSLADGFTCTAEIIGQDAATDIALIRINGSALPMVELGDSDKLKVGQMAIAVGNPMGFRIPLPPVLSAPWGVLYAARPAALSRTLSRRMLPLIPVTAAAPW
jgi:S1-C subfamily serine protease